MSTINHYKIAVQTKYQIKVDRYNIDKKTTRSSFVDDAETPEEAIKLFEEFATREMDRNRVEESKRVNLSKTRIMYPINSNTICILYIEETPVEIERTPYDPNDCDHCEEDSAPDRNETEESIEDDGETEFYTLAYRKISKNEKFHKDLIDEFFKTYIPQNEDKDEYGNKALYRSLKFETIVEVAANVLNNVLPKLVSSEGIKIESFTDDSVGISGYHVSVTDSNDPEGSQIPIEFELVIS